MRRLVLVPILLLGLAAGSAFGAGQRATDSSTVGKISALGEHSISVHGKRDLTCRVTERSPKLTGFSLGDRVGIGCRDGELRRIVRIPAGRSTSGTVRFLGAHSIGVDGDHDLSCRRNGDSPDLHELALGDKVAIACADGVLVKISLPSAEPEVKTAGGTITALDSSSITVRGERNLTCGLTGDSFIPREFKVGDEVGIACIDGIVRKIVRLPQATEPPATTSTTKATTTTPTVTLSATGAITALGEAAISVHGDHDTSCTLASTSPKLGDYKLGDKVKITCTNGVLTGIVRTS